MFFLGVDWIISQESVSSLYIWQNKFPSESHPPNIITKLSLILIIVWPPLQAGMSPTTRGFSHVQDYRFSKWRSLKALFKSPPAKTKR